MVSVCNIPNTIWNIVPVLTDFINKWLKIKKGGMHILYGSLHKTPYYKDFYF